MRIIFDAFSTNDQPGEKRGSIVPESKARESARRLAKAILDHDFILVNKLLEGGCDPNFLDSAEPDGLPISYTNHIDPALMYVVFNLLRLKKDKSAQNVSLAQIDFAIMDLLLRKGANPNACCFLQQLICYQDLRQRKDEKTVESIINEATEHLVNNSYIKVNLNGSNDLLIAEIYLAKNVSCTLEKIVFLLKKGACPEEAKLVNYIRSLAPFMGDHALLEGMGLIEYILTPFGGDYEENFLRFRIASMLYNLGFDVPNEFTRDSFHYYLSLLSACRQGFSRSVKYELLHLEITPKSLKNLALKQACLTSRDLSIEAIYSLLDMGVIVNEFESLCYFKRAIPLRDQDRVPSGWNEYVLHLLLDYIDVNKPVGVVPINLWADSVEVQQLKLCHPNVVIGKLELGRSNLDEMASESLLGAPLALPAFFTNQLLAQDVNVPGYTMTGLLRMISRIDRRIKSVVQLEKMIAAEIEKHKYVSDISYLTAYSAVLKDQLEVLKRIQELRVNELKTREDELKRYCDSMSNRSALNLSSLVLRESELFMGAQLPQEVQAIIINKVLRASFDKHFPDRFFEFLTDAIIDRAKKIVLKSKTGEPVVIEDTLSTRTWLPSGKVLKEPKINAMEVERMYSYTDDAKDDKAEPRCQFK